MVKVDVMQTLLDHDSVESVSEQDRDSHLFYCLTGVGCGLTATVLQETSAFMKQMLGTFALFLTMFREI